MKVFVLLCVCLSLNVFATETVLLDSRNTEGWKQSGPGKFNVKNGVAISEGGMGLYWYSLKKFRNVSFHLEFKMGDKSHNSGVFVLFDDPGNDPVAAAKSGYEVQINNASPSKHSTGAIYDLKASTKVPLKDGWNKYKITCVDGSIVVKLNGKIINVFKGERGAEGYFGIQNHDPNSAVSFRNIRAVEHNELEEIFRPEEKVQIRRVVNPKESQYNVMDIGSHLTGAVEVMQNKSNAYKGLTVFLGHELNPYSITYDTDLMRVASVNHAKLGLIGSLWNGQHDTTLKQQTGFMVTSTALPGWSLTDSFVDDRKMPFGPVSKELTHFKGIYRNGGRVAIKYTVGNTQIIESPKVERHGEEYGVSRTLTVAARQHDLLMSVGDFNRTVDLKEDGKVAHLESETGKKISIVVVGENLKLQQHKNRLSIKIPAGEKKLNFKLVMVKSAKHLSWSGFTKGIEDVEKFLKPGKARYNTEIAVKGNISKDTKAYVVDDIPVPFNNPWNVFMRTAAFDFFKDGKTAAVSTWNGDVWLVKNIDGDFSNIKWKRICTGLYEPLGLKIVDEKIYVTCRDMIARLHDNNGDDEIDFIENFNNDVMATANHHEYCFDLKTDKEGNFYFAKAAPVNRGGRGFQTITPHSGALIKVSKDGKKMEVYSTGMRAPNGIGVSPEGQVTAGDNEGTWVPHCKLHWLKPNSFQGVKPVAHKSQNTDNYNRPLCWFPMEVDNSGGDQVWVTDSRFGLREGELLHLSYGTSSIYRVLKETVKGQIQGGVVRLPVQLGSSAMRSRFNEKDGQLYVIGLKGWQTNAAKDAAFQRVRYTGKKVTVPSGLEIKKNGVVLQFDCELDKELAEDPNSYSVKWWNYLWGPQYGSGEFSVFNPDQNALKSGLIK
ncbi:MAG: DUF1080 domain-containing protein, partial [Lentisphaeraceae bacterium]|nr:DUF1080 domain-containing protein [Lentisphaeraceae bacterium]